MFAILNVIHFWKPDPSVWVYIILTRNWKPRNLENTAYFLKRKFYWATSTVLCLDLNVFRDGTGGQKILTEHLFIYHDKNKAFPPLEGAIYWNGVNCTAQS
jgi:hypothetical protein